jgi:hypothetical protein
MFKQIIGLKARLGFLKGPLIARVFEILLNYRYLKTFKIKLAFLFLLKVLEPFVEML